MPESYPETIPVFMRKKGSGSKKVLKREEYNIGRIGWIPVPIEHTTKPKTRRFPYYWSQKDKCWKLVRSGPRPELLFNKHLEDMAGSGFMSA